MKTANKQLNNQTLLLEKAETEIRQIVKTEYLKNTPKKNIDIIIKKLILDVVKNIKITNLKSASIKSLIKFYSSQYNTIKLLFNGDSYALSSLLLLNSQTATKQEKTKALSILRNKGFFPKEMIANIYGQGNNEFVKNYMEKVAQTFNKLSNLHPKDPDDISGKNSLRNRAEMEVRYQEHLDNINQLKAEGHKLVIASTHADCSKRCSEWQGRVFSLDGSSGTTDDGREFVPLENATDVYYTTKAGKTYKNGLLGFNCRHYLVAYKSGFSFPQPNEKKERKEYAITIKQRELERNVRHWRDVAVQNKNVDNNKYLKAKEKAIEWNKKYIAYSQKNNRAYYPSRTKII